MVRNPLCPFYTTSIDKEGITKSLSIGPFSVSKTDKFSDPRTLKNMYNDILLSEKGLYMPDLKTGCIIKLTLYCKI